MEGGRWWGAERSAGPVASTEVGREDVTAVALPFASPASGGSGAAARVGRAELGFRGAWRGSRAPDAFPSPKPYSTEGTQGGQGLLPGPP